MTEPDLPQFACVGCGVMNPVGAETCSGCGHHFAGPSGQPPSRPRRAAPISDFATPVRRSGAGGLALTILKVSGVTVLVLISSLFAFVVTCVPIGLANINQNGDSLSLALVAGGLAAVLVGGGVTALFARLFRKPAAKGPSAGDQP